MYWDSLKMDIVRIYGQYYSNNVYKRCNLMIYSNSSNLC